MTNQHLYPAIDPYNYGMLDTEAPHRLYFEQCGDARGIPVVFLHGGPGSGCSPTQRRFLDPERYRIVLFDQRGAGRSEPKACLENNSTQALVGDLERLRAHLRINRWLLYGGSWGATLALLYAQQHPHNVLGLVLRGVFLARSRDLVWFYGPGGVARIFPHDYHSFISYLAPPDRTDPVGAYYRLFAATESAIREEAARRWQAWEARVVRQFLPPPPGEPPDPEEMLRRARILSHYALHNFFLGGDGVPFQFKQLRDKPCVIVHGQRDLVCPLESAWTLHQAWPRSELRVVREGGHVTAEPAIGQATVQAFDDMAGRFTVD